MVSGNYARLHGETGSFKWIDVPEVMMKQMKKQVYTQGCCATGPIADSKQPKALAGAANRQEIAVCFFFSWISAREGQKPLVIDQANRISMIVVEIFLPKSHSFSLFSCPIELSTLQRWFLAIL